MTAALPKNILQKLMDKNMSVSSLEKESGLKKSAVQNIIYQRSKNPSIKLIHAIAQELECSVDELLEENVGTPLKEKVPSSSKDEKTEWNPILFFEVVKHVVNKIKKTNVVFSKEEGLFCIDEIYRFSLRDPEKKVDPRFVEWIMERSQKD